MKIISVVLVLFAFVSINLSFATEADRRLLSQDSAHVAIEQVLKVLDENYVYPETAKEMRQFISKEISSGNYREIHSLKALITKLQSNLRDVSRDGHISLHLAKDSADRNTHIRPTTESNRKIYSSLVSGNNDQKKIAYLRFDKFSGDSNTKERITAAMRELEASDSLIIDLRHNIGGDPNLVAFLSSYFLDGNTLLWSILDREGNTVFEAISLDQEQKYRGELCLLTSEKTYSAAEAFAYTLKHLSRAFIIGEATGGGAHLVQMERVNDEIDIRIPVARAYNPITKSNWEGIGVIPTVEVEASKAKSAAIEYLTNRDH